MKKAINILSIIDLSILALWTVLLVLSRLFAETTFFAAATVIVYAIAILAVLIHTIATAILLIKKKKYSRPLLISAYLINILWVAILVAVINYAINILQGGIS